MKFDVANAPTLDAADRMAWNNPQRIVSAVNIPRGVRVAEVGCGTGWFTFELETAVRPRGMVYALDMQPAMLQILQEKRNSWQRILTLPCDENEFQLDAGEVDIVFHANTLHECAEPEMHLCEARRVLKEGGRLILIDWHLADEESQPGPPNTQRLDVNTTRQMVMAAGFEVSDVINVGPYHYAVQAVKS